MANGNAVKRNVAEVAKTFGASTVKCCVVELAKTFGDTMATAETLGEFRYGNPLWGARWL